MEYQGGLDPRKVAKDLGIDLGHTEDHGMKGIILTKGASADASTVKCACGWENQFYPDQASYQSGRAKTGGERHWPTQDDFSSDPDRDCPSCGEELGTDDVS